MARGYPGAFGRQVNALYVWLPLCLLFLRAVHPLAPAGRRCCTSTCWCCSAFSVSLAFFNHAQIGISVPLVYPFLLYLLVRMLLLALRRAGAPRAPLRLIVPGAWLAVASCSWSAFASG